MKVGIVTTWFERGAAYVSKQIKESLEAQNYEVYVFARGSEYDKNWDADNVFWAKRQFSPMPTDINKKEFLNWIKKNCIELIIFNEQHFWQPVIWAKEVNVKVVAYVDYYKENTIDAFGLYDQIWCNTKRHYSVFNKFKQAVYIPWGTDTALFKPQIVTNEKFTFFHSAGMSPERKGTEVFLRASALLAEKRDDFKAIIHSQVNLSNKLPELKNIIINLEGMGVLEVINKTVPAPGLYHLGDVYVYPSFLEGIGLTIAEALSVGLPTIVTDEPPMNEFVSDYCKVIDVEKRYSRADGYYWPVSQASFCSLSNKMEEFLVLRENSELNINEVKRKVREHALNKLDWKKNAKTLEDLVGACESRAIDDNALRVANLRDYYAVPYFSKAKFLYYLAYDFHKLISK